MFPCICSFSKLGKPFPISDGRMPERELFPRYKILNDEMLKSFKATCPLNLLFDNCRVSSLSRQPISSGIEPDGGTIHESCMSIYAWMEH
jgi:hypothetical protein